ncbi:MAG: 4-vinyl reductase [Acidobacteria bacterium]|nr:4-vinyl reductase [Acidobacteriota bacterium]
MFQEERKEFRFEWAHLGDIQNGRPNLGAQTSVAVYRLLEFTLRDAAIKHCGVESANRIFRGAGRNSGTAVYEHLIGSATDWNDLLFKMQQRFKDLGVGILRVESVDEAKQHLVLSIYEDLDCSGLPAVGEAVCTFDEGLLAGLLEAYVGVAFTVREVDCWCTGERVCRFEATPAA